MIFVPPDAGTGTVRVAVRRGMSRAVERSAPVPIPSSLSEEQALICRMRQPYLEMTAWPGAVPCARHHARQVLWDWCLKELIEPVELVVSELVTNAVRASGGLETRRRSAGEPRPVVCLWLVPEHNGVLVLAWDASPCLPQRQQPGVEDDGGRGLLLVETLSAKWGSFKIADKPGKVVWALCQS